MRTRAGLERLVTFLDAVVAIAITLLILPLVDVLEDMERIGIAGSLMSLGAIDFGLVVDSSVVMVENCVRRLAHDRTNRPKIAVIRDAWSSSRCSVRTVSCAARSPESQTHVLPPLGGSALVACLAVLGIKLCVAAVPYLRRVAVATAKP